MNPYYPIYTKKTECQDCYKCVRACPVKAIRVSEGSASVINERCVGCGKCIEVCPVGAKHVRNDVERVKRILSMKDKVIVSLAPSFISEFQECSKAQLIAALKKLGFAHVSETALGAQRVSQKMAECVDMDQPQVLISSACPTIVSMIKKYYPQYSSLVADLYSPVLAHCRLLKENWGQETGIIFIGPCISKKNEADENSDLLDVAISFDDLRAWLQEENIDLQDMQASAVEFVPFDAETGVLYAIDGGMLRGIQEYSQNPHVHYMSFSGLSAVIDALDNLADYQLEHPVVLELMACKGGCVNGPNGSSRTATIRKRLDVQNFAQQQKNSGTWSTSSEINYANPVILVNAGRYTDEEINHVLHKIGKYSQSDELNCSACGYDSCRDFAAAMLEGRAEKSMCASYMRKLATKKANTLLKTMPSGVVIVDEQLKIVECNMNFCHLIGGDAEMIYQTIPGMEGASLEKLVPFSDYFKNVLETGEDLLNKEIPFKTGALIGSIFTIEQHGFVGGIFQNAKMPALHQQQVIQKTRKVIENNLAVVQQIAYLLGENASETEMMLDSIIQSLTNAPAEAE